MFSEAGCLNGPYPFANAESRLAFLERPARAADYPAFEDFRCTAYVMSGLPGAGKDTWIARNLPQLPVVSLDAIRVQNRVSPRGNQGRGRVVPSAVIAGLARKLEPPTLAEAHEVTLVVG